MEQVMEQLYKQRHNENNQVVLKDMTIHHVIYCYLERDNWVLKFRMNNSP